MRKTLFLLLLIVSATSARSAGGGPKIVCMAEAVPDRPTLYVDDSCLVTLYVYAPLPMEAVEPPKRLRVKGGNARALPIGRRQVQRVMRQGRVFYRTVGARYVVASSGTKTIEVGAAEFRLTFRLSRSAADLFGLSGYRRVEAKAESVPLQLPVVARPRQSTQEALRSGKMVI